MGLVVVLDAEFNKLENPDVLHCVVCRDLKDNLYAFKKDSLKDFEEFSKKVSVFIGHNIIDYDIPNILSVLGVQLPLERCIDTLIVSRLVNYGIEGGHSVSAWAKRLRLPEQKIDIRDFSCYTEDILQRCIVDTGIQKEI